MKFSADPKEFREAVNAAAMIAPTRGHSPILSCLRLDARDNAVIITGTDLDTEVQARCEAAVSEPGAKCVNASDFKAVVARMSGTIDVSGDMTIKSGRARLTLPTMPADDFPSMTRPDDGSEIEGGIGAYLECAPFASTDTSRFHMMGVCFDTDTAVGVDGPTFRAVPISGGTGQIIPAAARPIIQKIGGRMFLSDRVWRVESDGRAAMGKLIDGQFVDWRKISFQSDPAFSVDADALTEAIEAVTVGRATNVVFTAGDGGFTISGDKFQGDHIDGEFFVPVDAGEELKSFVVATKFMLRILTAMEGRVLKVSHNNLFIRVDGGVGHCMIGGLRDHRSQLAA